VPLVVIQRQLGRANLAITSLYLQGIDSTEIIDTVHSRPAPVISASLAWTVDSHAGDQRVVNGRPAAPVSARSASPSVIVRETCIRDFTGTG
jgi:hypothetical protein